MGVAISIVKLTISSERQEFQISEQKTFYLPGPRPMTCTYQGIARVCAVRNA